MPDDNPQVVPVPPALASKNPLNWLVVFGPGAIIASITLGSGELIFSTRGGALFGYDILFLFVLISVLKWGLVFAMARHFVLSGVHPYERMVHLPGPRGWFPLMLLMLFAMAQTVWTGFFPGILGNFTSWVTGTQPVWNGAIDYVWGVLFLAVAFTLTFTSGYAVLERVQISIVAIMMVCAIISLVIYNPDWFDMLYSSVIYQPLVYPEWLPDKYPQIAEKNEWVETTRYVGVIGGAAFDYLAYTAWLREKHWGRTSSGPATEEELQQTADDPKHPARLWVRAPLVDCLSSFVLVVVFSAVFVASGVVVLGPQNEIPTQDNFLDLQAKFVTNIHPILLPIYVVGAYLTIFGTLYGTYEIGITVLREITRAIDHDFAERNWHGLRRFAILWLTVGGSGVLIWSFFYTLQGKTLSEITMSGTADDPVATLVEWNVEERTSVAAGETLAILRAHDGQVTEVVAERPGTVFELKVQPNQEVGPGDVLAIMGAKAKPRVLLALLTPANLFTGVLAVGLMCFLLPWMDWQFLPKALRMPNWLVALNCASGVLFLYLGYRGYMDNHKPEGSLIESIWFYLGALLVIVLLSLALATAFERRAKSKELA